MRKLGIHFVHAILLASTPLLVNAETFSCTTTTASANGSAIQSAINSASAGAVICVPSGSGSGDFTLNKPVTVVGAAQRGAGTTTTTGRFTITGATGAARVTGFTFNINSYHTIEWSTGFRVDHNIINFSPGSDFGILAYGDQNTPVEGLIDNNTFKNCKVVYFGSHDGAGAGNPRWSEPLNMGTAKALYVEDNTFNLTDVGSYNNSVDSNWGSRFVIRFNTFLNGRIEQHSLQGNNQRAARLWEIYNNTMSNPLWKNYRPYFIRGGTGMVFHNTSDGKFLNNEIDIDNARSSEDSIAGQLGAFGFCDGTHFPDGNMSGQQGWPCRDQIGRSTDASFWTGFGSPSPAQASAPAYFWRNTEPGGETPVSRSCETAGNPRCIRQNTYHLLGNRDYYAYSSSFNGTVGIGEGPLASRPATCTTGVAYWATDVGEWNSRNPGPDGQLYRCAAPNTWSLYYTPYQYPHPLQAGGGGGSLPAPGNLRVQ